MRLGDRRTTGLPMPLDSVRAGLASPWTIGAFALLAVNDHFLKASWPCLLTGKLSDFSGLFAFPFLALSAANALLAALDALLSATRIRLPRLCRFTARRLFIVQLAIGAAFVSIKLSPSASGFYEGLLTSAFGTPGANCADPWDCLGLLAFLPALLLARRLERGMEGVSNAPEGSDKQPIAWIVGAQGLRRSARWAAWAVLVAFAAAVSMATSYARKEGGGGWDVVQDPSKTFSSPDLTQLPDGTLVAVWSESSGGDAEVAVTVSRDEGKSFGSTASVSNSPSLDSARPRIACSSAGIVFVVWEEETSAGSEEVLLAVSTDGGSTFPGPLINLSSNAGSSVRPDILVGQSGAVRVSWIDDTSGTSEILHRDSLDGGATFRPQLVVASLPPGSSAIEVVTAEDPSGLVCVAWTQDNGTAGLIRLASSADGGLTFGAPSAAHAPLAMFPIHLSLAAPIAGSLTLAWNEVDAIVSPTRSEVFMARSADSGSSWASPARITAGGALEGVTGLDLEVGFGYGVETAFTLFDRQDGPGSGEIFAARWEQGRGTELSEMSATTGETAYGVREKVPRAFREARGGYSAVWAGSEGIWFGKWNVYWYVPR